LSVMLAGVFYFTMGSGPSLSLHVNMITCCMLNKFFAITIFFDIKQTWLIKRRPRTRNDPGLLNELKHRSIDTEKFISVLIDIQTGLSYCT